MLRPTWSKNVPKKGSTSLSVGAGVRMGPRAHVWAEKGGGIVSREVHGAEGLWSNLSRNEPSLSIQSSQR